MQASSTYNVFHRRQQPELRCAVRQDRPIPTFISGETWDCGGTVRPTEPTPAGFRLEAADAATRLTGYYLFQTL
ncbi:hypothetical protein [Methylobacterium nigriterrae]|uniref:hypothetical protein n=1 Tax=Methylobacterium nigriterrae TaxID=3127512 RepID=UPI00301375C1